ncbi:MAG: HDIG domain-containing protein [Clostridiales bacterium]|nr:HDIG domain-containing protein [Clostridiales bacterium]
MEAEKSSENISYDPPKAAYWWTAGIFAIVYAVIYISLVVYIHFAANGSGILGLADTHAYVLYAFVFLFFFVAMYIYIVVSRRELLYSLKRVGAIMSLFTIVVVINIVLMAFSAYLICVALSAMLILPFTKKRDAFVLNIFSCLVTLFVLIATLEHNEFPAVAFTLIAGLIGGAVATYSFPSGMTRVVSLLRSFVTGCVTIVVYFVLLSTYRLSVAPFVDKIMYIGISVSGELLLTAAIVPVVEWVFNLTSDFKLMELINHKAPLIKRLIKEAPGTFNHCLAVANFAEICADAIGEDPYLARACAYYHDVGKLNNVMYFTENQAGYNPHDEILPEVSAEIIRKHTVDGYELCKKHHIPEEVARATIEHQGTLPIMYFYNKAKSLTDGDVDINEYRYYGEIPTGKMGAIIMICDSSEAAIRAMDNPTGEKVDKLLKAMIDDRLKNGQFDNCAITMKDLNAIRLAIVGAYGGLYHKRIKYNNGSGGGTNV